MSVAQFLRDFPACNQQQSNSRFKPKSLELEFNKSREDQNSYIERLEFLLEANRMEREKTAINFAKYSRNRNLNKY